MLRRLGILAAALTGAFAAFLGGWFLLRRARPFGPLAPSVEANIRAFDLPDAEMYERAVTRFLAPVYRALARDFVRRVDGARVLDIGAGPGHLAEEIARLRPQMAITGVDIMPEMVRLAGRRARQARLDSRLSFVEGDVVELPFEAESFDAVISSFSMHHWEDTAAGLREIERVLVPGGRAFIYDLPPWFLWVAAHAADSSDPRPGAVFSTVRDRHLGWPLGIPFLRRLELSKGQVGSRGSGATN